MIVTTPNPNSGLYELETLQPIFDALDNYGDKFQDGDSVTRNTPLIDVFTDHGRAMNPVADHINGLVQLIAITLMEGYADDKPAELFSYDQLITLIYHSGTRIWAVKVLHKKSVFDMMIGIHVFCILDYTPIDNTYYVKNFNHTLNADRLF